MPVTQIPPRDPIAPAPQPPEQPGLFEAQPWETAYRRFNPDDVPHLLIQLQDDLSRSRKREALWLSVILHLLFVILLVNSEKLMMLLPHRTLLLTTSVDLDKQKDATFLELPPDEQKATRRPDAKIISDKDRIATSKAPQIDRQELKRILESSRPGRPGEAEAQSPAMAQNQPPQESPQQNNNSGFSAPAQNPQIAQLQAPPQGGRKPSFDTPMTAGSAIEKAARDGRRQPRQVWWRRRRRLRLEPGPGRTQGARPGGNPDRHYGRGFWTLSGADRANRAPELV